MGEWMVPAASLTGTFGDHAYGEVMLDEKDKTKAK